MDVHGLIHIEGLMRSHSDAVEQVRAWLAIVQKSTWKTPHDVMRQFPKAFPLGDKVYVFDICYNKYRIAVKIAFNSNTVLIMKAGTHKEYDRWKL